MIARSWFPMVFRFKSVILLMSSDAFLAHSLLTTLLNRTGFSNDIVKTGEEPALLDDLLTSAWEVLHD